MIEYKASKIIVKNIILTGFKDAEDKYNQLYAYEIFLKFLIYPLSTASKGIQHSFFVNVTLIIDL